MFYCPAVIFKNGVGKTSQTFEFAKKIVKNVIFHINALSLSDCNIIIYNDTHHTVQGNTYQSIL